MSAILGPHGLPPRCLYHRGLDCDCGCGQSPLDPVLRITTRAQSAYIPLDTLIADILTKQLAAIEAQQAYMRKVEDLLSILTLTKGGAQS